jgi:Uma2 family endonuclease
MEARMSGAASPTKWTYADYARLPDDGNRYEVLDGKVLTTPSPSASHQMIAEALYFRLREYIRDHQLGRMIWDLDLLFVSGQFLRPDMMFVPNAERHRLLDRGMEGIPGLVVEIVSPSSGRIDKIMKPARYADFGIPEYWAVDPERRAILVWDFEHGATEPRIETSRVVWQPDPLASALELDVTSIFEDQP